MVSGIVRAGLAAVAFIGAVTIVPDIAFIGGTLPTRIALILATVGLSTAVLPAFLARVAGPLRQRAIGIFAVALVGGLDRRIRHRRVAGRVGDRDCGPPQTPDRCRRRRRPRRRARRRADAARAGARGPADRPPLDRRVGPEPGSPLGRPRDLPLVGRGRADLRDRLVAPARPRLREHDPGGLGDPGRLFGGLAIGAVVGGRLADRARSPLRMYGILELASSSWC